MGSDAAPTCNLVSVSDHSNCGSSFVVDMERVLEKDAITSTSRILRNLSRKGSIRVNGETKFSVDATPSPRASTLHGGGSTPEIPSVVALGPTDHHSHHQITITAGGGGGGAATESKLAAAKRLGLRRAWTTDPRRIVFFFATLSSMGTILLIYFTLSMGKPNANTTSI